jgi:chorismate mutase
MCKLHLEYIAACLENYEDTIIYKLLDRAQFKQNISAYSAMANDFKESKTVSLFDNRLRLQEEIDSKFGRFLDPAEKPFTKNLPPSQRQASHPSAYSFPKIDCRINFTYKIKHRYLKSIKILSKPGDDWHYGSSVELDVYALQAISRRVHFGAIYIAESKYQKKPDYYRNLILANDSDLIMSSLTRKDKEDEIITRVCKKLSTVQSLINTRVRNLISTDIIVHFYENIIIPITKEGEVSYLLKKKAQLLRHK